MKGQKPSFQRHIYGAIESGHPAIVYFATSGRRSHVIPIVGHTFVEDMWPPKADSTYFNYKRLGRAGHITSDAWLGAFIAHDDNCGTHVRVPPRYLYVQPKCRKLLRRSHPCDVLPPCVLHVIATAPQAAAISVGDADVLADAYLRPVLKAYRSKPVQNSQWRDRVTRYAAAKRLVLRLVLVSLKEYAEHLRYERGVLGCGVSDKVTEALHEAPTKHAWMAEISLGELFSRHRHKVGEVLINAGTMAPEDQDDPRRRFIMARLPGYIITVDQQFRMRFDPSEAAHHVPLFRCSNV